MEFLILKEVLEGKYVFYVIYISCKNDFPPTPNSDLRLNPKIVDGEVSVLKQVTGPDPQKHCLQSIDYFGMLSLSIFT